jgi:hypothetical protein
MLQMSRRTARPRRNGRAELAGLALVLIAGAATARWAGERIGIDMTGLSNVARAVGVFDRGRPLRELVGTDTPRLEAAEERTAATGYCQKGQQPTFELGVARLKQQLGDTMGTPVECEHPVSANGDTIQQTTTGLVIYRAATNTVIFTDGWRHWALTSRGMVSWEGTEADPPRG